MHGHLPSILCCLQLPFSAQFRRCRKTQHQEAPSLCLCQKASTARGNRRHWKRQRALLIEAVGGSNQWAIFSLCWLTYVGGGAWITTHFFQVHTSIICELQVISSLFQLLRPFLIHFFIISLVFYLFSVVSVVSSFFLLGGEDKGMA